jgi:hypothetical protein
MPQNTATPTSSSIDLEYGNSVSFSQSTTDSRASTPTDTAATPTNTAAIPTDIAAIPTDTAAIPTDTAAIPTDTAAIPTDTAAIPTDTAAQSFQDLLGFPEPKSNVAKRRAKKLEDILKNSMNKNNGPLVTKAPMIDSPTRDLNGLNTAYNQEATKDGIAPPGSAGYSAKPGSVKHSLPGPIVVDLTSAIPGSVKHSLPGPVVIDLTSDDDQHQSKKRRTSELRKNVGAKDDRGACQVENPMVALEIGEDSLLNHYSSTKSF